MGPRWNAALVARRGGGCSEAIEEEGEAFLERGAKVGVVGVVKEVEGGLGLRGEVTAQGEALVVGVDDETRGGLDMGDGAEVEELGEACEADLVGPCLKGREIDDEGALRVEIGMLVGGIGDGAQEGQESLWAEGVKPIDGVEGGPGEAVLEVVERLGGVVDHGPGPIEERVVRAMGAAGRAGAMAPLPGAGEAGQAIGEAGPRSSAEPAGLVKALQTARIIANSLALADEDPLLDLVFDIHEGTANGVGEVVATDGGQVEEVEQVKGIVGKVGGFTQVEFAKFSEFDAGAAKVGDPVLELGEGGGASEVGVGPMAGLHEGDGQFHKCGIFGQGLKSGEEATQGFAGNAMVVASGSKGQSGAKCGQ